MAVAAFEAGRAALKAGQRERGVNLLSRSLQSGYQPLLCYRELATGYAALGRHREAAWAEGKSRMLTHQWPAAEAAFVRSAALDPAKPAAYLELSRTQSAQGRLADALQTCDRARKAGADSLDLRLHRASVLGRMERIPEQQRELEAASRLDPARANEPLGNLGRLYHDSQQFDRAITTLEEALRLEAGDGLAHLYLGLAYARRSEDPERAARAADHLLSAALIDPAYFYPWINAGSVLLGMGHVSEAAACYRRAMDGDSRWEGPYLSLSQLLQRQKRLPERKLVLQLYGRARTLEAERQRLENQAKDPAAGAEAHLELGERLLLDGRAKEACVELLIATAARPSLKRAQSRLADACALLDFDDLREEAERALR
jgi:tetratricopeptide (TPR) repeat protein